MKRSPNGTLALDWDKSFYCRLLKEVEYHGTLRLCGPEEEKKGKPVAYRLHSCGQR